METWLVEILALAVVAACTMLGAYQGLLRKLYFLVRGLLYFAGTAIVTSLLLMLLPATMQGREAVAAVTALVITGVILHFLAKTLKLVDHIPVVNKLNKLGGALLGALYGLLLLWIVMFVFYFCRENVPWIDHVMQAVTRSDILRKLYEQNPLQGWMK